MSGFIVASSPRPFSADAVESRLQPAVVAFTKKGMRLTHSANLDDFIIRLFGTGSHDPAAALTTDGMGRFCTYTGTLFYRGRTGCDATALILADQLSGHSNCIDEAIGNFCLLINGHSGLRIVTDRAGLHHVYHDEGLSLVCNSFLATACALPRKTLQTQEILEYVQLGATFGSSSLVQEVMLLGSECEIRIAEESRELVSRDSVWAEKPGAWRNVELEHRLVQTIEACDQYYSQVSRTFGDKTTAALSGGYDSRLNLALLLRHRMKPALFVYGAAHDSDVEIAKLICKSEGLALTHIDRASASSFAPDDYWQNQEDVFHGLDGLTQYGFACEPDEISHRRKRVEGGLLAINGGGGEIWRDFWRLPDKPLRAIDFVRGYFGGRLGGLRGGQRAETRFFQKLADKVRLVAGAKNEPMSTAVVQSLYARFRLRYWQGKNNSVDNHLGLALTPFSEHHFSVSAISIPMRAKRDGWFERQLIRHVSPRLAGYPSAYGYDFERGPAFTNRMRTHITCVTPFWLRAARRAREKYSNRPYFQADRYIVARFGTGPLAVEEYFDLLKLRDPLSFSRALTVERFLRGQWV